MKFLKFMGLLFIVTFVDITIYSQRKNLVSVGIGSGNTAGLGAKIRFSVNTDFKRTISIPFQIKYERRINEKIGICLSVSHVNIFGSWEGSNTRGLFIFASYYPGTYTVSSTSIVMRTNSSFVRNKKIDIYWGAGFGLKLEKTKVKYFSKSEFGEEVPEPFEQQSRVPVAMELVAGFRWFLIPEMALFSEVGFAKSLVQVGVTVGF